MFIKDLLAGIIIKLGRAQEDICKTLSKDSLTMYKNTGLECQHLYKFQLPARADPGRQQVMAQVLAVEGV